MSLEKRGWLFRLTWPLTHYLVTHLSVMLGLVLFRGLNHTTVLGKKNVPQTPNTLLLSNHQSMIDSFLVGGIAFFPRALFNPCLLPWSPAAAENFYRNPVLRRLSDNWKCIPVRRGRKDVRAIFRMTKVLEYGTMLIFPEGTRSRNGTIGKAHGGAGVLVLETQPTVIPVCIDGMDKVLPIGAIVPRIFKRIYVYYGEPIDLSQYYGREVSKGVSEEIMQLVMERIRMMKLELSAIQDGKKRLPEKDGLESGNLKSQKA